MDFTIQTVIVGRLKLIFFSLENKYHVDCTTRNFQDSVDYCNKSGYIIAAFHSDGDINQIKSDFVSSSCDYVYIGAIADGSGGWKWLDNSAWDWVYKQRTDLIDQRMRETRIAWAKNSDTWQDWGQGNAKMGVICQKITGILPLIANMSSPENVT